MHKLIKGIFGCQTEDNEKRIEIIDFLRGSAMILVLLHHSGVPFGEYILAFHMPLFFMLSGYTQKIREDICQPLNIKEYVTKRFKRLIIPYLSFEMINFVIWCIKCFVVGEKVYWGSAFLSITTCINKRNYTGLCGRLWFLPCMFVSGLLSTLITVRFRTKYEQAGAVCVLFFLSWITTRFIPFRLPFTIDTAMMATAFVIIGYLCSDVISYFLAKGHVVSDVIIAVFMGAVLFSLYRTDLTQMLMFRNRYGQYILSISAAISGSIAYIIAIKYVYYLLKRVVIVKQMVLWYSYNSLASFPVHLQIKCVILLVPCFAAIPWWALFLTMFFVNVPIVNITGNYFPFMLGKNRQKRNT